MEKRDYWIVAVDCPKHVVGVWEHFKGKELYLIDEEDQGFSWAITFANAKHFETLDSAKKFAGGIKRRDFSDLTTLRGSEYYSVFGLSDAIHMVKFIKVTLSFEVREFPESDFQELSDKEKLGLTDPDYAEFLRLQKKFKN